MRAEANRGEDIKIIALRRLYRTALIGQDWLERRPRRKKDTPISPVVRLLVRALSLHQRVRHCKNDRVLLDLRVHGLNYFLIECLALRRHTY